MGVVYRGLDLHLDRPVALKFLSPQMARRSEAESRFVIEAKAASALDHPHIVTVYDIDRTEDEQLFIAMAYYPGETLKKKIARGPLSPGEAVLYAIQVAEGLAEAHEHSIVHRDIKPSNILVTQEEKVKIVDFGLARLIEGSTLTDSGAVIGTAYYMSPEQIRGERVDHRTDIWSLGVLLYQMITGRLPFAGETTTGVMHAVLSSRPPRLESFNAEYPVSLQWVLDGALEKNREIRFADAAAMLNQLRQLYTAMSSDDVPTDVLEPPRIRRWRRRLHWLAAAAVLLFGLGLVTYWYISHPPAPPIDSSETGRFLEQAEDYEKRGDRRSHLENAELLYRRALEIDLENPHIQAHLASLLLRLHLSHKDPSRLTEARSLAQTALAAAPENSCAWVAQGRVELQSNANSAARADAWEAVGLDPRNTRAHVLLGEAQVAAGQEEEGLATLRTAIGMEDGHVWAHPTLARLLFNLGRNEEAEAEYRKVLEFLPDSPNALNNLGVIYMWTDKLEKAEELFRKSLQIQRDDYMAAMNLGTVYFYMNRMLDAIEAYQQAYELEPDIPLIQTNMAEAYEAMGSETTARPWYESALTTYDREFAATPPSAEKLTARAICAAKLGRFEEAIADVVEAYAVAETDHVEPDSIVLFNSAKVYALAGRRSETLNYAKQAIAAGYPVQQFGDEPIFALIREDPEFRALLEEAPDSE
jgi:serine/threonine protein kinase/Flp pilus assembly protein TadD